MNGMISVVLPLKTVSEANKHTHWRDRQKRAKGQHQFTCLLMGPPIRAAGIVPGEFKDHLVITLTRLSPQQLDSDNLAGSTKFVQDGVAEALGVDDRDPRLTWVYKQEKCKEYGVRVDIERKWKTMFPHNLKFKDSPTPLESCALALSRAFGMNFRACIRAIHALSEETEYLNIGLKRHEIQQQCAEISKEIASQTYIYPPGASF